MIKKGLTSVGKYLPAGLLQHLDLRQDGTSRAQAAWEACVPGPLADHVRPLRYEQGLLSVQADSSAWAGRLRQQQQGLLDLLRREPFFKHLRGFQVHVVPHARMAPKPKRAGSRGGTRHLRLSAQAARLILDIAEGIDDPRLRKAMRRLGNATDEREDVSAETTPDSTQRPK